MALSVGVVLIIYAVFTKKRMALDLLYEVVFFVQWHSGRQFGEI
jgi:hypothetical protein